MSISGLWNQGSMRVLMMLRMFFLCDFESEERIMVNHACWACFLWPEDLMVLGKVLHKRLSCLRFSACSAFMSDRIVKELGFNLDRCSRPPSLSRAALLAILSQCQRQKDSQKHTA